MDGAFWHVLHVLSNQEKRVAKHLEVRSLEHYVPFYSERMKWTDRSVITERPLFPGYVFAHFSPQNRSLVITVPGVCQDLGSEERNMVSAAELDRIREGLASGLLLRPHPCMEIGTRVRVSEGVFLGAEGVVKELRQQCRVILALSGIQQCFSLEVEAEALEVVQRPIVKATMRPASACAH